MKKIFVLLMGTLSFFNGNLYGASSFVSVFGNDNNSGSREQPYATLQHAVNVLNAGDTLFILPGYYKQKVLIKNLQGTREKPTVVKGLGQVIIDSPASVQLEDGELTIGDFGMPISNPEHLYYPYFRGAIVRVQNSAHVIIDGLRLINSPWFGLAAFQTHNLKVQFCYFEGHGASSVYLLNSKHPVVAFNEITRSNDFNARIQSHGSQECISVVNTDYADIQYNRIHEPGSYYYVEYQATGVGGEGIDVKENSKYSRIHHNYLYNLMRQGIYIDAWNSLENRGHKVYNNVVHNTQNGLALACEAKGKLEDIEVYNNLFFNNWLEGILLAAWGHGGEKKNIRIYNNTLFNNWEGGIRLGSDLHHDIIVANNIAYMNTRLKRENIDLGTAKNVNAANNFTDNPRFQDFAHGHFALAEGSPAIDAGIMLDSFPAYDLHGGKRVINELPDPGAFEFGGKPESPRVIYVGVDGNDADAGHFFKPYATLQHAIDKTSPGDKIVILPGIYQQKVKISAKGNKHTPLVIRGMGEVIFDGQLIDASEALFTFEGAQWFIMDGIEFQYTKGRSIDVMNSENGIITNCVVDGEEKQALKLMNNENVKLQHLLFKE